jgi:hypothetical protein
MAEGESGKEPGGWELYRSIQEIKTILQTQAALYLPIGVFNAEKQLLNNRIDNQGTDIKDVEAEIVELRTKLGEEHDARITAEQEREKEASGRRLQWTITIASPFMGVIAAWIAASMGLLHTGP